ncbi:BMP family ABC transporter substrate-binding protein [Crassaminicella thermophila]|uniref:BMP family ABC transporter substrate-binding protein n=1 Tax=Crassaminicella thermophila TaxID=2599308 RepID=A0A5C0SF33_CRATE|nr:BMP family ABC transporter substrate-binding protein [Crassaminicella thermophila]QEK13053.1 BMP family ABC transporter substrate-binding protein [Crassaminicella thermophila]
MKKAIVLLLVMTIITTMALTGCGKTEEAVAPVEGEKDALKVGLVVAGGLGDRSFYDSSNEGIEKAKEELGIEAKVFECRNDASLFNDQLIQASQYASVVVVVGFEFYDAIQEVAAEFPDVKYIYVDNVVEGISNITCIDYMENEGSFLAGALAAMLTQDKNIEGMNEEKIIGMVGGMDIPVIRNFKVGYEQGAKYIDPEIKVETIFAGDFEDPAKGKESALALYAKGVDVIFSVAGKTGEGVFEAAKDSKAYAIGVDSDQRYINPDAIVASMIKGVGLSIYESIQRIQDGTFETGKVYKYGIKENGVKMGYGTADMKQFVTDDMRAKLEEIQEKIVNGEIQVDEVK